MKFEVYPNECEIIYEYEYIKWMNGLFKYFEELISNICLEGDLLEYWEGSDMEYQEFYVSKNFIIKVKPNNRFDVIRIVDLPIHVQKFLKAIFVNKSLITIRHKLNFVVRRADEIRVGSDKLKTMLDEIMVSRICNV